MKTIKLILSAGVAGAIFTAAVAVVSAAPGTNTPPATNAVDAAKAPPGDNTDAQPPPAPEDKPNADDKSTPAVTPPEEPSSNIDTNVVVDASTGEIKLRIQFRNAPLESVLKYMSAAAGYTINERVTPSARVTVWSEQPLNKEEALKLVKKMLDENGYTALSDGNTLTIIRSADAKKENIPVVVGNIPTNIPMNTEIVTQIIPVRSLNAVSLLKDLQPLLPADTTLTANESGNALVMTDTQANIHRITEIVRGLDSVSSSSATIIVFPLKFADAKSVASLIKDLFPSANAAAGGAGGGPGGFGFFSRFSRGGGGIPGGGGEGGGQNDTGAGHTPSSRISAVSDDHANAVVVSAPDDLVPTIKELVAQLDTDVEDTTVLKVFNLKYADPIETASELTSLFPDDTKQDDNSSFSSRYRFGFFGQPPQASAASANQSDRVKRLNRVLAVPDPRTRSLIVSASKDMMPQIGIMIEGLDSNPRFKQQMFVMTLSNAEVFDVLPVLQDLFPSGKTSSSSSGNTLQNSALYLRNQTFQSSANSTTAQPFGSTGGGSGRAPGQ